MDWIFYGFVVLVFSACILMVEGAWLWWSGTRGRGARRIAHRLDMMTVRGEGAEKVSILKQRRYSASAAVERVLLRLPKVAQLDRLLLRAGWTCTVGQFLARSAPSAVLGLMPAALLEMPAAVALGLAALGFALPYLLLLRAGAARMRKIEGQLAETADFLARALRSGHSFSNVLQMVGSELAEPISGEFRMTYEEVNYGVPMNDALHNLAARVPLTDLRYLVIAVLIQRESGGNLAEVLNSIARIIRERHKLLGQVRVMAAEGKMSAWILGLLPMVTGLVMTVVNPAYIGILWTDPMGIRLLWYAGGMVLGGVLWMRSVIRIRV
ncbi:MAG TPA: pilus assembly protein TadB [Janthinobacterium sp.]|nr:pilus assembly protein TadB [Janthinobacterium sp.]